MDMKARRDNSRLQNNNHHTQPSTGVRSLASERRTSRRGHAPQISISDTDHHVTEAIGGMYGSDDEDYTTPPSNYRDRPLSFLHNPKEAYDGNYFDKKQSSPPPRSPHTLTQDRISVRGEGSRGNETPRKPSLPSSDPMPSPPPLSRSSSQDTAIQQFPLNDIDYESSPAAVAQELSNLQAIRRMSMNVDTADPDLPGFSAGYGIPALPPSGSTDEDDASRLFWVPARLHPELAPKEFKTFIEDRVEKMKRLSDDGQSLSPSGLERQSSGSLRRKKSMLSRQIDTDKGYEDGAARLERQRTEKGEQEPQMANLSELETLVSDPATLIRRMSLGGGRKSQDSAIGVPPGGNTEDMPMLPSFGAGLKRSTRTAYRRGSLRKGERTPASKRAIGRQEGETESATSSPNPELDEPTPGITRVRTEPIGASSSFEPAENFSRPGRRVKPGIGPSMSSEDLVPQVRTSPTPEEQQGFQEPPQPPQPPPHQQHQQQQSSPPQQFHSRIASGGWTTAQLPGENAPVPHIIETPPPPEPSPPTLHKFPERKSSMPQSQPSASVQQTHNAPRQVPLIQSARTKHQPTDGRSTLDDLSSHPAMLPGSGASRTDDLTMVPTYDAKKAESKSGRKTSWGWLLGGEEKDKGRNEKQPQKERERERERERELEKEREKEAQKQREREDKEKEKLRKPKISSKLANQDKTRLDVLQTSIDGVVPRGRESLVLNREDVKLEEERKKESTRKSKGEDGKKEKDGLLSAIFGGGKRSKGTEDGSKKRLSNRSLSPEPPIRILKPDIDYNWTRFSILEERAIYRMAHIKLANPKRALYSQVLLSNFMYSYLAKVQMMHPQMQVAGGHQQQQQQQQRQKAEQQRQEEKQAEEFLQYQRWQEQQSRMEASQGQQAAETGNLSDRGHYNDRGYGNSYGYDQQHNGQQMQHAKGGDHHQGGGGYSNHAAAGGAVGGAARQQQGSHETDYLGYSKNSQPFDDDDDRWNTEDSNMFEGLS